MRTQARLGVLLAAVQKFTRKGRNLCNGENRQGKGPKPGLTTSRVQEQVASAQSVIPTDKRGSLSSKHKATAARIHPASRQLCSVAGRSDGSTEHGDPTRGVTDGGA